MAEDARRNLHGIEDLGVRTMSCFGVQQLGRTLGATMVDGRRDEAAQQSRPEKVAIVNVAELFSQGRVGHDASSRKVGSFDGAEPWAFAVEVLS